MTSDPHSDREVYTPHILPRSLSHGRSTTAQPAPTAPAPAPTVEGEANASQRQQLEPLTSQETRLYEGHPSLLNFVVSIGSSAATVAFGLIVFAVNPAVLITGLVLSAGTFARVWIMRRYWNYTVTPRRVEMVYGIINRSSEEVRICDIRNINVRREGIRGWLNVGDVEIATAGGGDVEVVFQGVLRPHAVKELIRSIQDNE